MISKPAKNVVIGAIGAVALVASMGAQGGCGTSTGLKAASTSNNSASNAGSSGNSASDAGSSYTSSNGDGTSSTDASTPPQASWYYVRPKILSKECFGSAGCNVSVKLVLSMTDPSAQGRTVEITVKVIGDESGPSIETIDVDDSGNYDPPTLELSTPSNGTLIKARITEVADNS